MKMKALLLLATVLALLATQRAFGQNDWGINYVQYPAGQVYSDPHIRFEFRITNHGPATFPAGTVINTAARIVGTVFSLDLLGPGPTPITLSQDLGVGESFNYDPGYLDGAQTLAFFAVDTGEFCLIVYGTSQDPVDLNFPNDPHPANNMECLVWTDGQVITGDGFPQAVTERKPYPNPSSGQVTMTLPQGFRGTLELYSTLGMRELEAELSASEAVVDLSSLPMGTYHYVLRDTRGRIVSHGNLLHR